MKSWAVILAFVCAGVAGALEKDDLPLIYENDFENGIDGLTMTDSKAWKHVQDDGNGVLALVQSSEYEPKVRSPLSIARIEDLNVSDFILEVDVKQTGREYGHRDMCFFFGYQGPEYFYYAHLATKADDHANSIFLVNNAPRVSIARERTDGTDWATGYQKVKIVRDTDKGTIEVFFNDMEKPVFHTVDNTFLFGGIGFGSFDDVGQFDNIRIWGKKSEEGSDTKNRALSPE